MKRSTPTEKKECPKKNEQYSKEECEFIMTCYFRGKPFKKIAERMKRNDTNCIKNVVYRVTMNVSHSVKKDKKRYDHKIKPEKLPLEVLTERTEAKKRILEFIQKRYLDPVIDDTPESLAWRTGLDVSQVKKIIRRYHIHKPKDTMKGFFNERS